MPRVGQVPFWQTTDGRSVVLYQGHVIDVLRRMPERSVHCAITSPPYWKLRDYGTATWEGGRADCNHSYKKSDLISSRLEGAKETQAHRMDYYKSICGKCSARRIDRQIGSEPSPDCGTHGQAQCRTADGASGCFVCTMVAVFREVRRVLRDDGNLWLNLGDSYNGSGGIGGGTKQPTNAGSITKPDNRRRQPGLAQGNLAGIPWRVALALQSDGWVLRSDIPWVKRSAMPESVQNRPAKALEYVFLFSKCKWVEPKTETALKVISPEDARWLALLFDTQGCIGIKKDRKDENRVSYELQIGVGMTSRELFLKSRDMVGAGSMNERPGKNAPVWQWQLAGRQARDLLRIIYPYLIVKKRQARIAIYLQSLLKHRGTLYSKHRTDDETAALEALYQACRSCNSFGQPDTSFIPEPDDVKSVVGRWVPQTYYFDMEAIKPKSIDPEALTGRNPRNPDKFAQHDPIGKAATRSGFANIPEGKTYPTRNFRNADLWFESVNAPHGMTGVGDELVGIDVTSESYPGAHYAVFGKRLITPMVLAGTSEKGACAKCGAPWRRVVKREHYGSYHDHTGDGVQYEMRQRDAAGRSHGPTGDYTPPKTIGWQPTCECHGKIVSARKRVKVKRRADDSDAGDRDHTIESHRNGQGITSLDSGVDIVEKEIEVTVKEYVPSIPLEEHPIVPCVLLDPFIGSGTLCVVALENGRHSFGIDLSERYLKDNAIPRIEGACLQRPATAHLVSRPKTTMNLGERRKVK